METEIKTLHNSNIELYKNLNKDNLPFTETLKLISHLHQAQKYIDDNSIVSMFFCTELNRHLVQLIVIYGRVNSPASSSQE